MVRRAAEPEQDITLTGATNKQDFPAKVVDDAAAEDNRRRIQAAKEADLERATFPAEREALAAEPASKTLASGAKVTGPKAVLDGLR